MIVEPKGGSELEPSLIEDVVMPHAAPFTDVSREEVRRRAIGNLQLQYDRSRKRDPRRSIGASVRSPIKPSKNTPKSHYTLVPPLRSLPDSYSGTAVFLPSLIHAPEGLIKNLAGGLGRLKRLAAAALTFLFGWLPKRYAAGSGLKTDWDTAIYGARMAVPIILILAVLGLLLFGIATSPSHHGVTTTNTTPGILQSVNISGNSAGNKNAGSHPSTTQSSQQSTAAGTATTLPAGYSLTPSGTSSTLSGGMGGGPVPSTTSPTTSTVPTSPVNLNLTIPPTDVSGGGKTLLDTSGTNIAVN